jgi:hypothetical protein
MERNSHLFMNGAVPGLSCDNRMLWRMMESALPFTGPGVVCGGLPALFAPALSCCSFAAPLQIILTSLPAFLTQLELSVVR